MGLVYFSNFFKCWLVSQVAFSCVFAENILYNERIGNLVLTSGERVILQSDIKHGENEPALFAELGVNLKKGKNIIPCTDNKTDTICLNWKNVTFLRIQKLNGFCHNIEWNNSEPVEDCLSYGNANWFGGPEWNEQLWPVEKLRFMSLPYITSLQNNMGLVEPYWLNSQGLFIFVHYDVPLFIDSNYHKSNSLCLISNNTYPYNTQKRNIKLKYTVCQLDDPRKALEYAIQEKFISKPLDIPDTKMVEHPIWSTWVKFKADINETAILKYAESIIHHQFNNSQLEIDDRWETCYGSMIFNKTRFPDIKLLSSKLKKIGFRITIWRHPFVNVDCGNYSLLNNTGFFVKNLSGYDVNMWWNGLGSIYDFTNLTVKKWFQDKHKEFLEKSGIDGFKFDAGECSFIPLNSLLTGDPDYYPNSFTTSYVSTVSVFGKLTEVRVGHNTQHYPIYIRMLDKDSKWNLQNGLQTVITTCLLLNLHGYSWVLPDMVGGNAYGSDVVTEELFIRWLQVNTFMPVIQFSITPWDFNNQNIYWEKIFLLHLYWKKEQ
ncbi:myogenesis-regulating glycosidase-like isoform X2 [Lycorma delicatula]|uniref:myogenesis-regulating glycosidase-like isoform X2 n=1 Tax=Lycorma delicatula TaxID=130591 RepID=UPI003F512382